MEGKINILAFMETEAMVRDKVKTQSVFDTGPGPSCPPVSNLLSFLGPRGGWGALGAAGVSGMM